MLVRTLAPSGRAVRYTMGSTRRLSDSLSRELLREVKSAANRESVRALLAKANAKAFDLSDTMRGIADPFGAVEAELAAVSAGLLALVASPHPLLGLMARHHLAVPGKRLRPAVVLLVGQACAGEAGRATPRHVQLAEIVELIHTASLAHDDVLGKARSGRHEDGPRRLTHPQITHRTDAGIRRSTRSMAISWPFWWATSCWRVRQWRWRGCTTTRSPNSWQR